MQVIKTKLESAINLASLYLILKRVKEKYKNKKIFRLCNLETQSRIYDIVIIDLETIDLNLFFTFYSSKTTYVIYMLIISFYK